MNEDPKPTKEIIEWHKIDKLRGSQLQSLMNDLSELSAQEKDIKARIAAVRELIDPLITGISPAIRVGQKRIDWYPESTPEKGDVDESKLITVLGLTPEEVDKCRNKPKPKKAYFKVTTVQTNEESSSLAPDVG